MAGMETLTKSQRALIAARMATRTKEENLVPNAYHRGKAGEPDSKTIAEAAAEMGVGTTLVQRAKLLLRIGTPEQILSVEDGSRSVDDVVRSITG